MFRSVRNTLEARLIQDNAICYVLGFMIGIGGFAEATLIGMGIYILMVFTKPPQNDSLLMWSNDIAVVSIGLLLIVYWSYVDPNSLITGVDPRFCRINSIESLSKTETIKIIVTTIFGISCNHSPTKKLRKLLFGVSIGLSLYVIPTLIGSTVLQGFRGGGDKIFDIFSGNISAQSTTAGYVAIMIIGIVGALKSKRLIMLATVLALMTGIQTSNRSVLLIGILGCIIQYINWVKLQISLKRKYPHSVKSIKLLVLFGILAITTFTMIIGSQFFLSRIIAALDGRVGLYLEGYSRLFEYLLNPTKNLLGDAGNQNWWHSVPLDATRAGNLSGAYLSLTLLAILVSGLILSLIKKSLSLCLLAFALLFIYMTGMPLAAGGYEFVSLYCGYLLLSNELLRNPQN